MKYGHKGNAKVTTLAVQATNTDLTITVTDATGWPDGSTGPFWASIAKGTLTEEKVLFVSRAGNLLQVWTGTGSNGRGMDDTVAQAHDVNASIEHVWTATEAELTSAHINSGSGAHGYPAITEIVTKTGAQTLDDKTLTDAIITAPTVTNPTTTGGTHTGATKMSLSGAQTAAEFRVRNIYIGTSAPSDAVGNDGDIYIVGDI